MDNKLLIQDLADAIAAKEGLTKKKAEAFLKALFETIEEGLLTDKFVKIKGLGTFKVITVGERESVNINTGERFFIEGHERITFTPDAMIKDLVNRPFSHFQTVVINDETDINEMESIEDEVTAPHDESSKETENQNISPKKAEKPHHTEDNIKIEKSEEESSVNSNNDDDTVLAPNGSETLQVTTGKETETDELSKNKDNGQDSNASEGHIEIREVDKDDKTSTEVTQPLTTNFGFSTESSAVSNNKDDLETEKKEEEKNSSSSENRSEEETEEKIPPKGSTGQESTENFNFTDDSDDFPKDKDNFKYIIRDLDSKRTIWKTTSIILLAILLLILSYFAGYFRWLCPCELIQIIAPAHVTTSEKPAPIETAPPVPIRILPDSGTTISDSVVTVQNDSLSKDSNLTTTVAKEKDMKERISTPKAWPPPSKKSKPIENKAKETQPTNQQPSKKENTPVVKNIYKQVPGGNYEILGTVRTHKIKRGETIREIALEEYGSKNFAIYIITYNNIANPDYVNAGTVLKLPKLRKKN